MSCDSGMNESEKCDFLIIFFRLVTAPAVFTPNTSAPITTVQTESLTFDIRINSIQEVDPTGVIFQRYSLIASNLTAFGSILKSTLDIIILLTTQMIPVI